ncbi:endolytic transglycosylase MltG [Kitasatospora azatica]|uniref:endolytic transglycosylase MltG n=1 Tax=Kitasatospora azatica TaxID=58347 RepID=UPI00068BB513|nr:endolytic transglycosylase MltG [Kitasatospora azatica]
MDQDAVPGLTPGHLGAPVHEPGPDPERPPPKPRRRRPHRTGLACSLTVLLLALLAGGALLTGQQIVAALRQGTPTPSADYPGAGSGAVRVSVPQGASLTSIGQILQRNQVVASVKAFTDAAAGSGIGDRIQPGTYALRRKMSAGAALQVLGDPANANALTVPEGWRASQIYAAVDQRLALAAGTTQHTAQQHSAELGLPEYAGGNPEGLLYPATYSVTADSTPLTLLQQMVHHGAGELSDAGLDHPAVGELTPYQVLAVASLLQGESDNPGDMARVARVIYNRLDRAMPLQLDSTINYALGRTSLHTTVTDTQLDSPYNTYRAPGLPPTPIDNPGHDAVEAALNPAPGDWLYFVTVRPGDTRFTDSEEQQRKNVEEFNANQAHSGSSPHPGGR